jgi:hypothetical protein
VNVPEREIVRKKRLAFSSEVLVKQGDRVRPETVVARTMLPLPRLFFLSAFRALPQGGPEGYEAGWLVEPGRPVDIDTPLVDFIPVDDRWDEPDWWTGTPRPARVRTFRSPLPGVIESIMKETGQVLLRESIDYGTRRATVEVGLRLHVRGRALKRCLKRSVGDFVEKGQILAQRVETGDEASPGQVGFVRAPIAGLVKDIDLDRGLIRIEREFNEVEIRAGFFGEVAAIDDEAITITANGRRVQGVCGIGPESFGRLRVAVPDPRSKLTADLIAHGDAGMILVGGSHVGLEALRRAAEAGVGGIICGGADHQDLCEFLGEDFAVAITGREKAPFPIVITTEFGAAPMDEELFAFFQKCSGSWVHVTATTHMRAGVIRPEIIVMSGAGAPVRGQDVL